MDLRIDIEHDPHLPDIHLELYEAVYLLLGHNGCGKTTLLNRVSEPVGCVLPCEHLLESAFPEVDGIGRAGAGYEEAKHVLGTLLGARVGQVVGLDDVGGRWHPHTARALKVAIRTVAEEKNLTVFLVTQNSSLISSFREDPELVLVMTRTGVRRLSDMHDEDWLMCFDLADLYSQLEISSPFKVS